MLAATLTTFSVLSARATVLIPGTDIPEAVVKPFSYVYSEGKRKSARLDAGSLLVATPVTTLTGESEESMRKMLSVGAYNLHIAVSEAVSE